MCSDSELSEASRQYAVAYRAHYSDHKLPSALALYQQVMASHPNDLEAEYSRMQIVNIVNAAVPKKELLNAQIGLLLTHFTNDAKYAAAAFCAAPNATATGRPAETTSKD